MGAKTWMLVYSDGNASEKLKNKPSLNEEATKELVNQLFPNDNAELLGKGDLSYTNPPDGEIFAGCFDGVSIIAASEFALDYPSKLDRRFLDYAEDQNVYLHAMHSVVDWFAFAKWESGQLIRSLSLSPDSGIMEDIGDKLEFEKDYWEGTHLAVDPEDEEDEYPFAFHPLELGEEVLKQFFGYQLEGYIDETLLEPETIPLLTFKRKRKPKWKFW